MKSSSSEMLLFKENLVTFRDVSVSDDSSCLGEPVKNTY